MRNAAFRPGVWITLDSEMADTTRHGRASRRRPLAGQVMYARRMELDWTLEKLGERANGIAIQTVVRVECGLTADQGYFQRACQCAWSRRG